VTFIKFAEEPPVAYCNKLFCYVIGTDSTYLALLGLCAFVFSTFICTDVVQFCSNC